MNDLRNGLKDKKHRWPYGIVPFEIEVDDFSKDEIDEINNVIKEYHNQTCIQFKERDDTDNSWISFRGDNDGCYSSVGRKGDGGQVINLKPPKCVKKGIITHEMLHALGFFHQQSSTERDDYVTILWDNIEDGREHNFLKYNASTVTNFGFGYDYQSIMHYSGKAFSKNGENTIVAKYKMGLFRKLVKFFTMRAVEGMFVVALIAIMPSLPPYGEYTGFTITPVQPLEGPLAVNTLLEKAEKLFEGKILGPESFTDYNGELYMSVVGGQILKYNSQQDKLSVVVSFSSDKCEGFHTEPECGRPLGLQFDNNGNLIVAEAYSGIWKVNVKTGKKELLVSTKNEIDGKPINLPNSVAVAKNGDIYWTDSSSEYQLRDIMYSLVADGTGRLFRYSVSTKQNEVLIDNLHFANGVHLSEKEDFVIVCDLIKSRILRYYLQGPKRNTHDVFLDGLPGLPDNISSNRRGGFLVALVMGHDQSHPNLLQIFSRFSLIRKLVNRLIGLTDFGLKTINDFYPNYYAQLGVHYVGTMRPIPFITPKRTTILEVDNDGNILRSFHALNGTIKTICEGYIFEDSLYLGSPYNDYLGRIKLSLVGIESNKGSTPIKQDKVKQQPTTTTPKPTTTTTSRPTTTTPKQTTTTPKPTTTTPRPTTTTPKPTTTQKPTTTTSKPTTTTPKPTTAPPKAKSTSQSQQTPSPSKPVKIKNEL